MAIKSVINKTIWSVISIIILFLSVQYFLNLTPLVSDEALEIHFKKHRQELEELVRRYREYPSEDGWHHLWKKQGDTPALLKKAGVEDVNYVGGDVWLPAPYSIETAEKIYSHAKNAKNLSLHHKFGTIGITFPQKIGYRYFSLRLGLIYKALRFYPESPRIENGWLLYPVDRYGRITYKEKVVPSLNTLPRDWERGCVLKQLEPNWFIAMCRS